MSVSERMEMMNSRRAKSSLSPKKVKITDMDIVPLDKETHTLGDSHTLDLYKFEREHTESPDRAQEKSVRRGNKVSRIRDVNSRRF